MVDFIIKDSGKREEYRTGMVRDTQEGKPDYALIIPTYMKNNMLKRWAEHMTKGSKKYSQPVRVEMDNMSIIQSLADEMEKCTAKITKVELYIQKDYADHATKSNFLGLTQNSQKGREKTQKRGNDAIQIGSRNFNIIDTMIPLSALGTRKPKDGIDSNLLGLPPRALNYYLNSRRIDVESARRSYETVPVILTMNIQEKGKGKEMQEVIYVMGVTERLECWEILLKVLKERYNISKILRVEGISNDSSYVYLNNERNWEKAQTQEELERFKSSAFRHFIQWMSGEVDEDHAAAVLFNIQAAEYVKERIYHE